MEVARRQRLSGDHAIQVDVLDKSDPGICGTLFQKSGATALGASALLATPPSKQKYVTVSRRESVWKKEKNCSILYFWIRYIVLG